LPAGTGHITWWWIITGVIALLILAWIYQGTRPKARAVNRAMPKPDGEPPPEGPRDEQ
jgi:hypothetical protein